MLAGCSAPAKENGTSGEEPKTEAEKVTLNLNHFLSPMHPMHSKVLEPFAAELKEKTEGRVEIVLHPSNGLAAPGDTIDAVESGVVDIGFTLPAYTPGRFLLSTIFEFPFMFSTSYQGNMTAKELLPVLQEHDYKSMKLLWFGGTDLGHVLLKKPVNTVAGLKGLKLRSPGPIYNDVIKGLNAVEVSLPVSDLYDALDRGIADGTFMTPSALMSFKLAEVVSNIIELELYMTPLVMTMNKDSWNKISQADQQIMLELLDKFPEKIGKQYDYEFAHGMQHAKDKGINVARFSDEEMKKFHNIVDPMIQKWLADMDAKGLPGKDTFDKVKKFAEQYK